MYRNITKEQYLQHFNLPSGYKLDGILCVGSSYPRKERARLEKALQAGGIEHEWAALPLQSERENLFDAVQELKIDGKVLWYLCAYGGALLSEYLHFGYLFGARKTVLIGTCGGLNPAAQTCDIIIPTSSQADGSTAHMYDREHRALQPSDKTLSEHLAKRCEQLDLNVHRGKTMTCQAMIAETWEDVQKWSSDGYLGVEMEAATVFAVSNHFERPSAAVLSVADNLIQKETHLHENYQSLKEFREGVKVKQCQAALSSLL